MSDEADNFDYELPDDVEKWLEAETEARRTQRENFQAFEKSVSELPPLEKAERWLRFVAETRAAPGWGGSYGDEEALVYLRSRGHSCDDFIEALVTEWRGDAERVIERGSYFSITDEDGTRVERSPLVPESGVRDIREVMRSVIGDFWGGGRHKELHIDAAMLRAAYWCRIGGFEGWWERLAEDENEAALVGGADPKRMSYWGANMARADLAYDLMSTALERATEAMMVPLARDKEGPWIHLNPLREKPASEPMFAAHYGHAANIAMAVPLVREQVPTGVERACEVLLRSQRSDGGWPTLDVLDESSIDTTARAVHGLVFCRPHGWERAVDAAVDFLLDRQATAGYWQEEAMRDATFLTVLVLDAMALAGGSDSWTLARDQSGTTARPAGNAGEDGYRFEVALSFPGEARGLVGELARSLADDLGTARVLYDRFHEAEFARPNLDTHLQRLYRRESRLLVVFIGSDYERKEWPHLEWRAVRDMIKEREDDRVMFLRLDEGDVSGLFGIDGYIDVRDRDPDELVQAIHDRLEQLGRG
jgi:hypothetical protein